MVRNDMSLAALMDELSSTPCPTCLSFRFEFLLRCDLGNAECLPTAHCTDCGTSLILDRHFGTKVRSAIERREVGVCPHCQSGETHLALMCRLASHTSEAVGVCDDCNQVFALEGHPSRHSHGVSRRA